jgi:hypothetical protein
MGKKGKKIRSDRKKIAKQSLKARNRAHYDGLRDSGNNSKRAKRNKSKKGGSTDKGKHLIHNCGNVGCLNCNPEERKLVRVLNHKESLKIINRMFPYRKPKPQVHPGRNPSKLSKLRKVA